jgi:hypothetical protein
MAIRPFAASLVTTLLALAVYWLTLAPDLAWANAGSDGGELITAAVTLGIPHPSGYPLYVLLGKLFSWLPLGAVAFRLNLFSAVCVAVAAGLVTAVNSDYRLPITAPAIAAGLTFAFAPLVWSQALISEVYGLNLLCLALFLWALLTARPEAAVLPQRRSPSWLAGLFLGLSITTHLSSLLMLPLAILATRKARLPQLAVGILLGLTPFLLLPLLAQSGSPVVWGKPDTLQGWWWLVSGRLYHPNLLALSPEALATRLREWALILPGQFLWVGFVLMIVGVLKLVNSQQATINSEQSTAYRSSLTVYGLLLTIFLYLLYALGYNTTDALVFTLPALLLAALLLGPGLQRLGALALGLPLLLLLLNFQAQNLRQERVVRPFTQQLLQQTPANALLLSSDEATTFTLWYFHHVEEQRPDIIVADTNLFAFDWYRSQLRAQHPDLFVPEEDDLTAFYAGNEGARPLCHVQLHENDVPDIRCQE